MGVGDVMIPRVEFGIGRVTRFYIPLLLQAFSQSLTYPLVAGIVTHGAYGVNALTAFSQGQMIMFLIGAFGGGLVMTGMVFATSRGGYLNYRRLNTWMMIGLLILQCVPAIHPLDKIIFEGFFALPPELAQLARWTLVLGVVMNGSFFLRNVPMVVLFNNLQSGKANIATFVRILVTLVCAAVLPRYGLVGAYWGLAALTLGCVIEWFITWCFARPYVKDLMEEASDEDVVETVGAQFHFTLPLALGGFLLMISPLIIAAFVGRTENAADMLSIHYVTIGVANPVAYAALRMQAVSIEFPPAHCGDRRLLWYALGAGAILGLIPFLFSLPVVGNWYFGVYQNVPERLVGTARLAIFIYSFICFIHVVRGRIEGIAAVRKRPDAVMAGQVAYTAALFATLAILFPLGVPGWVMAIAAIFVAPACAGGAVYAALSYRVMWIVAHVKKERRRMRI